MGVEPDAAAVEDSREGLGLGKLQTELPATQQKWKQGLKEASVHLCSEPHSSQEPKRSHHPGACRDLIDGRNAVCLPKGTLFNLEERRAPG